MRNYQRMKNNPYLLPHNLYMQVLYIIKDYDRAKDEYHEIIGGNFSAKIDRGFDMDGNKAAVFAGRGKGGISHPTEDTAAKAELLYDRLHAIEQALMTIPPEYQQGVKRNIMYGTWFPADAGVRTYQYWKQRFVYHVAVRLKLA